MATNPATTELVCPHCGAKVGAKWKTCWLCGQELPGETGPVFVASKTSAAPRPAAGASAISIISKVAGAGIAALLALVFIGLVANGEYGALIGLVILLLPPLAITFGKTLSRQSKGEEVAWIDRVGTFLMSLAITIGVVTALGVAAVVAFFVICIAMISTGGMNFH